LQSGDWVRLSEYNFPVYSDWANHSIGQITRIDNVEANHAVIKDEASKYYNDGNDLRVWKIVPIKNVGIEKLKIYRSNSGDNDKGSNIWFEYAVNCWVKGVESQKTSRHHIDIWYSSHIYVSGCYFHEANSYGEGGRGYGVVLNFSTTNSLIENNIFKKLRHAMLVQAGANSNVYAYNYSREPYGVNNYGIPYTPHDLALHGNYPYANLFEQNYIEQIEADDSHDQNGPYNAFVRNFVNAAAIVLRNAPLTSLVGNQVYYELATIGNTSLGIDIYSKWPKGSGGYPNWPIATHTDYVWNNGFLNLNGVLLDISYFYSQRPEFLSLNYTFPSIGPRKVAYSQNIPAKDRYNSSVNTYIADPTNHPAIVIVDQKNSQNQSFGEAQLWKNGWHNYAVPDTFQWRVGSNQVLRADTNLNNSEKFHDWNGNEFLNHNNFEINQDLTNIVARHDPISEARIENYLLSSNTFNYGSIEFSDPWLRDYIETPYGKKNQGKGAPLKSYSLPLKLTTQPPFRGVFLNQDYNIPGNPYYSVRAPQQLMPFRDDLVPANLDHWEGDPDSVAFQSPNQTETAVVFKLDGAIARAVYKSPLVVSNASAIAHNNQRKLFYDGSTYHLVY